MTGKEQIDDAKFLIGLLKDKYDRSEARALVSAVLAIIRSVPDHLLEEFNSKLGINIPLSEDLRIREFEKKANLLNNLVSQNFISYEIIDK